MSKADYLVSEMEGVCNDTSSAQSEIAHMFSALTSTKGFEYIDVGSIHDPGAIFDNLLTECQNIKGEIVIVVDGNKEEVVDNNNYEEIINNLIKEGYTKKDAIKEVVNKYGVNKNKIYNIVKEK